jgi:hypothetical protein
LSAARLTVSVFARSARYSSRRWCAERALGPGKARGGPGEPGNRGLGVSGFSRCLHLPPAESRGAVCAYCRAQRGALCTFHGHPRWFCLHFPRSFVWRPAPIALHLPRSLVWWDPRQCGSGLVPPGVWYSRSRDGGSPTSVTSRLGVGVRLGKRKRHAASTSVQAAGGIEPGPRRTAPAPAGTAMYSQCAGNVAKLCGISAARCPGRNLRTVSVDL